MLRRWLKKITSILYVNRIFVILDNLKMRKNMGKVYCSLKSSYFKVSSIKISRSTESKKLNKVPIQVLSFREKDTVSANSNGQMANISRVSGVTERNRVMGCGNQRRGTCTKVNGRIITRTEKGYTSTEVALNTQVFSKIF